MRKLVPESLVESTIYKEHQKLTEGKVRDWFNKTKNLIGGVFKKVGDFFVALYKDKIVPAIAPINIGIMCKNKQIKNIEFIPSASDVQKEPSLSSMQSGKHILDRIKSDYQRLAKINTANKRLIRVFESTSYKRDKSLNEDKVPLKYTGEDKIRNVNSEFLVKRLMMQIRRPSLMPPLIWGAPGIGKTAITNSCIRSLGPGHRLIDVQTSRMTPDDWTLPAVRIFQKGKDGETQEVAKDIPKNWLPVFTPSNDPEENARRDDIANDGEGGIIFLDELSRAPEEVQNTCLKLIGERKIGDQVLGSKWAIIAATNRELDDPTGQVEISSALANRFQHWNFVPTADEWIEWAKGAGIDERITTFVDFNRDHFYLFDNETKVNTTPRSWEALSHILQACKDFNDILFTKADMEAMIAGTVNSATVEAFVAFLVLLEAFKPEQIRMVFTDPEKAPKPKKEGSGFNIPQANALIGAVCSQSKGRELSAKEVENYVQYFINLGNPSLAGKALFLLVETHPYIHKETGDIKGKEKYKKAMDMFRAAFGNIKFSSREDVMGG